MGLTADGNEALPQIRRYLTDFGIRWPSGYGAGGTIQALGVQGYPTVLLVGADNRVLWTDEQPGELDAAIDRALAAR